MRFFRVRNIDHIVLRVQDMDKSLDFYTNILGCEVAKRNEKYQMIHLRAGSAMIDIIDIKGPLGIEGGAAPENERRNVDHFCLNIEPFDESALIDYFKGLGMKVDRAETRYGAEGYGASIYIRDPDGNRVELKGK
ncbi:MAG: VOC family protein [Bacteroidales bacterium]|nr:VOC family protein [Bacteroidales bacterium]